MPPKRGKKKGKPGLGDWSDEDAVPGDNADAEADAEPPAQQQAPLQQPKGKKAKAKKKGKKLDWSDDDEMPAAPDAGGTEASDAELDAPRRSGSGSSHGAAGFAALPDEEADEAEEAASPSANGAHAHADSDDGSEEVGCACHCTHVLNVQVHALGVMLNTNDISLLSHAVHCMQMPEPIVARVTKVSKHPKADRLKVCQVDAGGGGSLLQV
jgi:tRNA-binding EMAP/Myf-like protein